MTAALEVLANEVSTQDRRITRLLAELDRARARIAAMERQQETDTALIAEQHQLIELLGQRPATTRGDDE